MANTLRVSLAIQAKYYQAKPPVGPEVVSQLVSGMEAEGVGLGWVVTSGVFSAEAMKEAERIQEERALQIELKDGEEFASMMIEGGLKLTAGIDQRRNER